MNRSRSILRLNSKKAPAVPARTLSDQKDGSLIPIWKRLKDPDAIDAYLRICKSLGINIEWPATIYHIPVLTPKIRMVNVVKTDPINVAHIKTEITIYVMTRHIDLEKHIAVSDMVAQQYYRSGASKKYREQPDWIDEDYFGLDRHGSRIDLGSWISN